MRKTLKILLVTLLPFCVEAVSVALGNAYSCAVLTDGRVMCWGSNYYGQLGDGSITSRSSPVEVSGMTNAQSIALGESHTCALLTNGKVMCWGYNEQGQLGDASTSARIFPVEVSGLTNAEGIALGSSHSCALLTDGKVMCWGGNTSGQLGIDKDLHPQSTTPVEVLGVTNAKGIALGTSHSCALLTDGKVKCWGYNNDGQSGENSASNYRTVAEVSGVTNAESIAVGGSHSCALLTDGKVMCWGSNDYGQLGVGYTNSLSAGTPVEVSGISNVESLSLGRSHSCALLTDGRVMCWGRNALNSGNGRLGDIGYVSSPSSTTPREVTGIATATGIALGGSHSCASLSDGKVMCWGINGGGQLGDMTTDDKVLRVEVLGLTLTSSPSPPPPPSPPPSTTTSSSPSPPPSPSPPQSTDLASSTLPPPPPCLCSGEYAVDESVSLAAKYSALVAIVLPSIIMSFL